jgi:predicted PurR-regulated permease PerM
MPVPNSENESVIWRVLYGAAVVFVLALFLYSLQEILNPFLLFILLVLLLAPLSGSRYHVLIVSTSAVLLLLWLLSTTGFLLAPFLLALVIAYVLHPLVTLIEERGVPRTVAIAFLAMPIVLGIVGGIMVGVPALSAQIALFIQSAPALYQSAIVLFEHWAASVQRLNIPGVDPDALLAQVREIRPEDVIAYLQLRQEELGRAVWQAILGAGRGVGTVLTVLSYVFLTPILSFYLLRDYNGLRARLSNLVPRPKQNLVIGFFSEYDRLLSRYLRGQLLDAAIVGFLIGLGFWLLNFPYALLLGVVAATFNIVPYLGVVISLIPALIIALFSGEILWSLLKIVLVMGTVQALDGAVIGPKIVGESVGLHPVWVILALAVAGYFWGFVGLLLAIPLAVLVKLLVMRALLRYEQSYLFRGEQSTLLAGGEAGTGGAVPAE